MTNQSPRYIIKNIRTLLTQGFTRDDLLRLCYDLTDFRSVYEQSDGDSDKTKIVDKLIIYAEQKLQIEKLLTLIKELNPSRYEQHQPYFYFSTPSSTPSKKVLTPEISAFEIRISRLGPNSYIAQIDSIAGQTKVTFSLPFDKPVIEATLAEFRNNLQNTRDLSKDRSFSPQNTKALTPEQIGSGFFNSVFQPQVIRFYEESYRQAKHKAQSLPIILNIDPKASDLINLPWEFLYDPPSPQRVRGQFLAFDQRTPIIRRWLKTTPVDFSYDPFLRVLLVSANPDQSMLLNVQKEHSHIKNKLNALNQAGQEKVRLEYLSAATLAQLKQVVRSPSRTPHIIHFMGHGGLGSLLMEDEMGDKEVISEQSLAITLKNAPYLRLVVLNACETAQTDLLAKQLGVAQALADARVPAIIAMQFLISDQAALVFAEEFYQLLAEGHPVDSAVTWARIAIRDEFENFATKEWGTPVLYLQAPDGYIFADLLGEPSRSQEILEPDERYPQGDETPISRTEQRRREETEKAAQIEALQQQRLEQLRRLRERETEVAGKYGNMDIPPYITLELAEARAEIKTVEKKLKELEPEINFEEFAPPATTTRPVHIRGVADTLPADSKGLGIHSQADKLYTQGQTAFEQGDWGQALGYLSRARKLAADRFPNVNLLVEQARLNWQQTTEGQNSRYTLNALYASAKDYLNQNPPNLEAAAALLEQIIRADADYQDAYKLASDTRAQADKEKAEKERQAKLKELHNRVQTLFETQTWPKAVEVLTQIGELDSTDEHAQNLLNEAIRQQTLADAYQEGEAAFRKRDWAKAVAAFGKVASINPEYQDVDQRLKESRRERQLDAWVQEAEDYLDQGAWDAAIEVLDQHQVADKREEARLALAYAHARLYFIDSNWAQVVEQLKQILSVRPTYRADVNSLYQRANDELYLRQQFNKAEDYIKQGDLLAAKANLESILQVRPDDQKIQRKLNHVNEEIRQADLYKKALNAIELRQWAQAIPYLEQIPNYKNAQSLVIEAQKQVKLDAFYRGGLEAAGNGQWTAAVAAFERVAALDANYREVAQQLQNARNKVILEESFTRGMQALQTGQAHFDLERLGEAVQYLETVARIDRRYRGVENRLREARREHFLLQQYLQGEAAYQAEKWAEAIQYWRIIVKDENEPDFHNDSARRLAKAEHQQRLADLYAQACRHFEATAWDNAVILLEQLQEEALEETFKDTKDLLTEAKLQQTLRHHYHQAEQLLIAEQWAEAIGYLKQIQTMRPAYRQTEVERMLSEAHLNRDADHLYEAGMTALQAENWGDAVTYFDRVYKLKPDFRDVETRLNQVRKQQTLDYHYQAARQALVAEVWAEAIDHLVDIQGLDPDYQDARQQLEEAERQHQLALDYQAALEHFEAGRWLEARDDFDHLLAGQKDYKQAQSLRNEAQQQLDMADKYQRALEKIRWAHAQPENWQSIVELLSAVVEQQADYQESSKLLAEAKQQAELYTLYQRATVLGVKDEIPALEQTVALLAQIIRIDLNYKDAVTLKAKHEAKVVEIQERERRIETRQKLKNLCNSAIEYAGKGRFDDVFSTLNQMLLLDDSYRKVLTEVDKTLQQYQDKSNRGQQLKNEGKLREALTILKEWEQENSELPDRVQTILKQNFPH